MDILKRYQNPLKGRYAFDKHSYMTTYIFGYGYYITVLYFYFLLFNLLLFFFIVKGILRNIPKWCGYV